jgi:dTDP-4-dehydrorhamnose reductase
MSQVLVTGANGQLGREIKKLRNLFSQVYTFTDVEELDLTEVAAIQNQLISRPAKYIINCAAYTDVDRAESDPDRAMLLNRDIVRNLSGALEKFPDTRLIHISTDYIFPGNLLRPLKEDDTPGPLNIYGLTKREGERVIQDHPRALIFRTSWLYSVFGRNFVKSMINRMDQKEELRVVYDQVGSPTYAEDLAKAIMQIISDVESGKKPFVPGIFNFSNEGVCSWYDLAMEVRRQISCGGSILPIETSGYPLPAKRPPYAVLNKSKIREVYGVEVPYWRDSLEKCIKGLL